MNMRIRNFVISLGLALALAVGILVSTGAAAFASTGAHTSGTQKAVTLSLSAVQMHTAAKQQAPSTSSGCATYLIPEYQWDEYLVAVSVSNPSFIIIFQTLPHYGQNYDVSLWDSFNGGKSITYLGAFKPPFPFVNSHVFYANGSIPEVTLCGYKAYLYSTL